jgi:hypothetical protein
MYFSLFIYSLFNDYFTVTQIKTRMKAWRTGKDVEGSGHVII